MEGRLVLRAPAKLNLTLEVLDRRADGLHALRSLMVPIDVADELTIEYAPGGLRFASDDTTLQHDNLVERALRALNLPHLDLFVRLRKNVPVGAGLGGGSSDAAAVLLAAMGGAFGPMPETDYLALARSLGSDVPFFLVQTGALVEGTGERVTAAGALPPWHAVVINPPVHVSTKDAYARLDRVPRPSRPRNASSSIAALVALQRGEFERVDELLSNDFESVIASETPEVARALAALRAAGAPHPVMTGSGSSVFALTRTTLDCETLAEAIDLPPEYRVLRTAFACGDAWRSAA